MTKKPLTLNPNYLAMVRGTRELHRLTAVGNDDSPEADALRDATDGPWESLTESERQRVRNLSEDLYSLSEPPPELQPMNPQAQAKLSDAIEATQRGDWDRALDLLRRWRSYVDPALLSFHRGFIWLEAGDPETAILFLEHASNLQPKIGKYLFRYLHTLALVDPVAARKRSEEILGNPSQHAPEVVTCATGVILQSIRGLRETESNQLVQRVIPILQDAFAKIQQGDETGVENTSYLMAIEFLGYCHGFLGETQKALHYYSEGLKIDPSNHRVLVARGILLYDAGSGAVGDFEMAIKQGSALVWPNYFLAHHRLVHGRYDEAAKLCDRALEMASSDAVKSELHEWMAISQACLGFPPEIVRKAFEDAIRHDPGNDRARENLAAFESATGTLTKIAWKIRSPGAVRLSVLVERRYSVPIENSYALAA